MDESMGFEGKAKSEPGRTQEQLIFFTTVKTPYGAWVFRPMQAHNACKAMWISQAR